MWSGAADGPAEPELYRVIVSTASSGTATTAITALTPRACSSSLWQTVQRAAGTTPRLFRNRRTVLIPSSRRLTATGQYFLAHGGATSAVAPRPDRLNTRSDCVTGLVQPETLECTWSTAPRERSNWPRIVAIEPCGWRGALR